jgi:hypothetical protein
VKAADPAVAVRAYATPDYALNAGGGSGGWRDLGPSRYQLIFDVETHPDLSQQRRVLGWQERYDGALRRRGIAYDPEQLTAQELDLVRAYALDHQCRLLTVDEFVRKVFLNLVVKRRALCIGFNLTFDLSRLAVEHAAIKVKHQGRRMRGGWSFQLVDEEWAPRLQVKPINGRAAFIRITNPGGRSAEAVNRAAGGDAADHRGYFADVAVGAAALFGRRFKLAQLADFLETDTRKGEERHGEKLTAEYLHYMCDDVQVTWECYLKIAARYAAYHLPTPLHQIYSEAGIGKAHLKAMRLRPWRQVQPDVPPGLLATIMETYYGGRTDCHIRRLPMPGVATDVTSEYPTVFVLQRLWPFLIASRVDWHDEDPAVISGQLQAMSVEQLLGPAFWPELTRLVQVEPAGDLLPTRTDVAAGGTFNLTMAHRYGPAQWFTYADVIVSWLNTGRLPKITRVLRFAAGPAQGGLLPVALAGRDDFTIDPYTDDMIKTAVELRAATRMQQKDAKAAGSDAEADLLDGQQQGLKIVSNSTGYGATIEVNTVINRRPQPVTVHLPDGSSERAHTRRVEEPGQYFHPAVATFVAGGGRLLLALIMRLVGDLGGSYVFCDTDSVFIVATEAGGLTPCPEGPHRTADGAAAVLALSWAHVDGIVDRLRTLNPYSGALTGESILKVEEENFDPATKQQRQIYAYSIASKRYAPFRYDEQGRPVLLAKGGKDGVFKRSEHGLGHLLSPVDQDPNSDDPHWRDEWWTQLLHDELGIPRAAPAWFDRPAVGRLAVSSPQEEASFKIHNAGLRYSERARPFNFAMMAFPKPGQPASDGALIAPLDTDPARWAHAPWRPRGAPQTPPVELRTGDPTYAIAGTVVVQTYRDVYDEYRQHPEAKAAGPGGHPCRPATRGLLGPLTITASELVRIGKEHNRLAGDDVVDGAEDQPVTYRPAARVCRGCSNHVVGRQQWCTEACRVRTRRRRRAS